ncbi:MAG TPA: tripartite tricarboxylate transporter TctB family protein [Burkholderiales bacterium]
MSEGREGRAAFRYKSAELAVAALFLVFGAIVIADSARLGFGWQEVHGPRPGYFPFIIGVIMCASALFNIGRALLMHGGRNKTFVEVGQLKMVLAVLVPSAVFAALVTWIGIYVASVLFIAFFMRWLGKYAWWKVAAVALSTAVVLYLVFEKWFKVPLPKGPLENLLGLG